MKITKINSEEYNWGENCKGWHLVNTNSLGIIQEIMSPNTKEVKHKHNYAQQFFYILKGEATFRIEKSKITVSAGEGIHIKKGIIHKIMNKSNIDLEFLVVSEPHSHVDRILVR